MAASAAAEVEMVPPLLEVEGISKHFAGVDALREVSLDVRPGEILGLLGENGAGKSTLLKILSGALSPSAGRIIFDGREYRPASPDEAKRAGIVTIYQELSLIPTLSVAENIFIGRAPTGPFGLIDWRRMREEARGIIGRVGPHDRPGHAGVAAVGGRAAAGRDRARAVAREPADHHGRADLGAHRDRGAASCCASWTGCGGEGVAIMFVTHRLEEASSICDRMTVLRDGRLAGNLVRGEGPIPVPQIIEKMVGRSASDLYARPRQRHDAGEVRLSVRGLRTERDPEAPHAIVLDGVDLDLRAGEILGVAGLVGLGPHGTGARHLRGRQGLGRDDPARREGDRAAIAGRRHRARHRAGAGGSQATGDLRHAGDPAEFLDRLARRLLRAARLHGGAQGAGGAGRVSEGPHHPHGLARAERSTGSRAATSRR